MSRVDSNDDRADELTERYRAASAGDPARPSDSVRQAILRHARTVAGDHATRGMVTGPTRRPAANDSSWRISAVASVLVVGFAAVLAWHFYAPTPIPAEASNPARSNISARNQPAGGSTVSSQSPEPLPADRRADTALAPNAVTTRSRQRAVAPAEAPREIGTAPDAAGSNPIDVQGERDNPIATAQATPAAVAPPPGLDKSRSVALSETKPARTSAAPSSLLVAAAESGNLQRVDQLLHSGISTEQTDARGRTALLVATLRGDVPMVRHLLAAGARADVVDADGDTPLAAARRQGPPELARLLERVTHPSTGRPR